MEKIGKSRTPVTERPVATVSLKLYKTLLNNAGFENHRHLTGMDIELNETGDVTNLSLGDAHRALEEQKKKENFRLFHGSSDKLKSGVLKLTDFLYAYKDSKRKKQS